MSQKQNSLESFFQKKRANDMSAEAFLAASEKKGAFKRKYQDYYLSYGFIATGDTQGPPSLCIICDERLANVSMKPSKLLRQIQTKHPALKDKPLQFFERKIHQLEGWKLLFKFISSTNVSSLKGSFLVAGRIAKAKKPFIIGEELILSVTKDICYELFGEDEVKKVANGPFRPRNSKKNW